MKNLFIIIFIFFYSISVSFSQNFSDKKDYNFSLNQYNDFLLKLQKNSDIVFVKQKDFQNFNDTDKICVCLRHDIDNDINTAILMAETENKIQIPATYFVLHTAKYYHPKNDFSTHNDRVLNQISYIQSLGHEIGIHNDLLTLQIIYGLSPFNFLRNELEWLRNNGIKIYGTASHGSSYCHKYKYLNYYFFTECSENPNVNFPNNKYVVKDNDSIWFEKANFSDFNFTYESYFTGYNKYYSDCSLKPDGSKFNPTVDIDISTWKKGDKIIILTHPGRWKNKTHAFIIYPNPCVKYFKVFIPNLLFNTFITLDFFDLNGNLIVSKTKNYTDNCTINIDLKKGMYILKVSYNLQGEKKFFSQQLFIK